MAVEQQEIEARIQRMVGNEFKGLCSHFILLAEVMDGNGDFYFIRLDDGDARPWIHEGLLSYAQNNPDESPEIDE